ncbi:MAG TPA: TRAP transporter substrate-binding protein [Burkholderiales bacterium]|nr:TRAP transporter substrate-binding protein [Burkholderiales bacterium]
MAAAPPAAPPALATAASITPLRFQGAWSAKDIRHEYALGFAAKVREMTGGELRIEVLPAGAVVPASELLDAVSKGVLDGGHGTLDQHYARQHAFALWGCGPAFGMDANMLLAWHKYGGGRGLLEKAYAAIAANVVSFLSGPMPTQPLGWFRKPIATPDDLKGLRLRAIGMSAELYTALGAVTQPTPEPDIVAALKSNALDAAEFNNASADRALGLPQAASVCMLQSYHENAEPLELLFNKPKYEALPVQIKAVVANAVEAASADMSWKAVDRYSTDYSEMRRGRAVVFYKTPRAVLERQLRAWDALAKRKASENPLFAEILESQRQFAARAVRWDLDTNVDRRVAYLHYFSGPGDTNPAGKKP